MRLLSILVGARRGLVTWRALVVLGLVFGGVGLGVLLAPQVRAEPSDAAQAGRVWGPSEVRQGAGVPWTGRALGDSRQCQACHQELYRQWSHSAHAFSSFNNPLYRASVDSLREKVGKRASRHCGGCHDPALLIDGALDQDVDPNDKRAFAGVGCLSCHAVTEHTPLGNGSYTLGVALPPQTLRPRSAADVAEHRAALGQPALRQSQLCGSCHRSFLDTRTGNAAHLVGMDDFGPWQASAFAGSTDRQIHELQPERRCQDCHMGRASVTRGVLKRRQVATHGFSAAHTWLYAALKDTAALGAARDSLRSAVDLQIHPVVQTEEGELVFEVSLRNTGTGHHFPGGTRDLQDTWLTATVRDANGALLGRSIEAHRLEALILDRAGQPVRTHRTADFFVAANDTTLAPSGSRLVRFHLPQPAGAPRPWVAEVRLLHRSRNAQSQYLACEAQQAPRGQAFLAGAERQGFVSFDACVSAPTTVLSEVTGPVNALPTAPSASPRAVYRRALARLDSWPADGFEPSLRRVSRALQNRTLAPRVRAGLELLGARLHSSQGRVDEALQWLARVRNPKPAWQSALQAVRGDALASVWRFEEARRAYRQALEFSPRSAPLWLSLAGAELNSAHPALASKAAAKGLLLNPLSLALNRTLALGARLEGAEREVAQRVYEKLIPSSEAAAVKSGCRQRTSGCRPLGVDVQLVLP